MIFISHTAVLAFFKGIKSRLVRGILSKFNFYRRFQDPKGLFEHLIYF